VCRAKSLPFFLRVASADSHFSCASRSLVGNFLRLSSGILLILWMCGTRDFMAFGDHFRVLAAIPPAPLCDQLGMGGSPCSRSLPKRFAHGVVISSNTVLALIAQTVRGFPVLVDAARFLTMPQLEHRLGCGAKLERVMNLGKSRIEMRISRSAWFPRDLCFLHS
jgi:hypothetical protein